jgi:cytochrome c oxidase assembly protein subunit 15
VFIFLVIFAGGVVRTTQSGMGCPDWPRCFGSWIPPTNASQLPPDYEKYLSSQDIDHTFNAFHTWVEYTNRLLGALLGVWILIHVIWSFRKFFKTQRSIFWLSFVLLLSTGFQGWLGKKVVDANLAVVKVTTHMLVALLIAAIPVIILDKLNRQQKIQDKYLKWFSVFTIALVILQIIFGTEVREQIDLISRSFNYGQRELWIGRMDVFFSIHKSFSWIVAFLCLYLFWRSLSFALLHTISMWILFLISGTMALGLSMAFLNIPAIAQPLHLLFSSTLIIALFAYRLKIK